MIGKPIDLLNYIYNLDKDKQYEIVEVKQKRSINSNDYFWTLCNKIGNVLKISKEDVHLTMLKDYGQILLIPLAPNQDPKGYFEYYEKFKETVIDGKEAIYYKVFKRSRDMDSKEMSILLDGVKHEADQLGIETKTPKELSILNSKWK
jgi:hypothetical protein